MGDRNTTNITSEELDPHIQRLEKSHSTPNNGDPVSRLFRTRMSGSRATSFNSGMHRQPTVSRATTSSTMASNEVSRLNVLRTVSYSATKVGDGEFVKDEKIRRRKSNGSSKSDKKFQYYGRHANSWLFNDFSVQQSVKKGWRKVFPKDEEE